MGLSDMFEPMWAEIEMFAGHNIATGMKKKLKFFQILFYDVRTDD